jgi:hypothetical protein
LQGAVISTTAATGIATAVLYWINHLAGMRLERGMIWLTVLPLALCGGAWCATALALVVAAALPFSRTLISASERDALAALYHETIARLGTLSKRAQPVEPRHAT